MVWLRLIDSGSFRRLIQRCRPPTFSLGEGRRRTFPTDMHHIEILKMEFLIRKFLQWNSSSKETSTGHKNKYSVCRAFGCSGEDAEILVRR